MDLPPNPLKKLIENGPGPGSRIDATQSRKLTEKWNEGTLTVNDITAYIGEWPPEMSENEARHIASNIHNLYMDITKGHRGTDWTRAIKENRWIDAFIHSDLVLLRGMNKVARFLHHVAPSDVVDKIESGYYRD